MFMAWHEIESFSTEASNGLIGPAVMMVSMEQWWNDK
jgi:hypothetical protein